MEENPQCTALCHALGRVSCHSGLPPGTTVAESSPATKLLQSSCRHTPYLLPCCLSWTCNSCPGHRILALVLPAPCSWLISALPTSSVWPGRTSPRPPQLCLPLSQRELNGTVPNTSSGSPIHFRHLKELKSTRAPCTPGSPIGPRRPPDLNVTPPQ